MVDEQRTPICGAQAEDLGGQAEVRAGGILWKLFLDRTSGLTKFSHYRIQKVVDQDGQKTEESSQETRQVKTNRQRTDNTSARIRNQEELFFAQAQSKGGSLKDSGHPVTGEKPRKFGTAGPLKSLKATCTDYWKSYKAEQRQLEQERHEEARREMIIVTGLPQGDIKCYIMLS